MKGIIFIPDISGFTSFVRATEASLGSMIIQDLLKLMMQHNQLNMEVSEIEGDAILFYKHGPPKPLPILIKSFIDMQMAFQMKFDEYRKRFGLLTTLNLKLIVHYGEIIVYNICGFNKLYGEAIIEAHRLLKSGGSCNNYILITEEYMRALQLKVCDLIYHDAAIQCDFGVRFKEVVYNSSPNTQRHFMFQT